MKELLLSEFARGRVLEYVPRNNELDAVIDQERRWNDAQRWSLADLDIPGRMGIPDPNNPERILTIREEKEQLDWSGLSNYLVSEAEKSIDPRDRERVMNLSKIAGSIDSLRLGLYKYLRKNGNNLPIKQQQALAQMLGPRDGVLREDTYFKHGARCASYVYDMGILDPHAFAVAGLHDLAVMLSFSVGSGLKSSQTPVSNVVRNKLKTSFIAFGLHDQLSDLPDQIIQFGQEDSRRQTKIARVFERLSTEQFPIGREFTWQQFIDFQNELASPNFTNNPTYSVDDKSTTIHYSYPPAEVGGNLKSGKIPNVVQVVSEANDEMTAKSARSKGKVRPPSKALYIAELATALDRSYFPKKPSPEQEKGDLLKQEQIYATAMMTHLFPLYQAFGDPPRRLAQEVIFRAFMPSVMDNLYKAMQQLSGECGGEYVDYYDKMYSDHMSQLVASLVKDNHSLHIVLDPEMAARRHEITLGRRKIEQLLGPDEMHVAGLGIESDGAFSMRLNRKNAASLVSKMIGTFANPNKFNELIDSVKQEPFGSVTFWRNVIPRTHDFLRTQFTVGGRSLRKVIGLLGNHFTEMYNEGKNTASSTKVDNAARASDRRERELYSIVESSLNIIFALTPADRRIIHNLNCEIHGIGADDDGIREHGHTIKHRAAYKQRDRIWRELRFITSRLPPDQIRSLADQMKIDLARESEKVKAHYLNMVFGITENPQSINGRVF